MINPTQAIKLVSYTSNSLSRNHPSFENGRKLMTLESAIPPKGLAISSKQENDVEMKDEADKD